MSGAPMMIRLWDTYAKFERFVRVDQILGVDDKGTMHGARCLVRLAGGDPSEWPDDLRVREMPDGEAVNA